LVVFEICNIGIYLSEANMPDIFVAKKKPVKTSPPQKTNALAAFIKKPKNINFETQEKKEEIVLFLRRHWITNVPWVLVIVLMLVAPVFLRFFPLLDFLPGRFQFITLIGWYLLTTAVVFEKFLSWLFNVNIITDERIVDIDFPSLLYREISSAKIDQVQDISTKVGGFIRSLFNYGDVLIQTAGTEPEICFEAVPRPGQVAKILNQMMLEEEQEKIEGRVR